MDKFIQNSNKVASGERTWCKCHPVTFYDPKYRGCYRCFKLDFKCCAQRIIDDLGIVIEDDPENPHVNEKMEFLK